MLELLFRLSCFFHVIQHPNGLPNTSYVLSPPSPIPTTFVSATMTSYPRKTTEGLLLLLFSLDPFSPLVHTVARACFAEMQTSLPPHHPEHIWFLKFKMHYVIFLLKSSRNCKVDKIKAKNETKSRVAWSIYYPVLLCLLPFLQSLHNGKLPLPWLEPLLLLLSSLKCPSLSWHPLSCHFLLKSHFSHPQLWFLHSHTPWNCIYSSSLNHGFRLV